MENNDYAIVIANMDRDTDNDMEIVSYSPSNPSTSKSLVVQQHQPEVFGQEYPILAIEDGSCQKNKDIVVIDSDSENIPWNTDDEMEINDYCEAHYGRSNSPTSKSHRLKAAGSSSGLLVDNYVNMGFKEDIIFKTLAETGTNNESTILDTLLTYTALHESPEYLEDPNENSDCSDFEHNSLSDTDCSDNEMEGNPDCLSDNARLRLLRRMGYKKDDVILAMDRCGIGASLSVLTDCITALELEREQNNNVSDDDKETVTPHGMQTTKKKQQSPGKQTRKKMQPSPRKQTRNKMQPSPDKQTRKKVMGKDNKDLIKLPNPMIGFGVPGLNSYPRVTQRTLPPEAVAPPYFYYENVAKAPTGVWDTISKKLYGVKPEFVDSMYFCAAMRKRGYVHNLPIHNRFLSKDPLTKDPLTDAKRLTIFGTFPDRKKHWPEWDKRTKLKCLLTSSSGSTKAQNEIRTAIQNYEGVPPLQTQKYVLERCRNCNFMWVGEKKVAPLEPEEMEILLGFPKDHTRGGGTTRTDRYKGLGNSFQVDTVAYHLSVLKPLFPNGMNVLSLFSGIGGAEVALHNLGIPMNNVVSIEKCEVSQNVVRSWWNQTKQRGTLTHYNDVKDFKTEMIRSLIDEIGGFDLVIGGSPCNNLAGSNRVSRDGLEGTESRLFYEYVRILEDVKAIMASMNDPS